MNEKTRDFIKKITIIISIIIIAFFAYSITPKTFQNDTFYTIRIGEHIIKNTNKCMLLIDILIVNSNVVPTRILNINSSKNNPVSFNCFIVIHPFNSF